MFESNGKPLDEQLCNKSYNSYKHSVIATEENCSRLERKIVEVLESEGRKLGPKEIQTLLASKKYGKFVIKGGSLRPLLKRLVEKGLIKCCDRGFYCSQRTYEVRLNPLRVHDVRISCELESEKLDSWVFEKQIGGVKVHVCFGSERSKITGGLYCDEGMDRDTCMFGLDKWANIAKEHLGRELPYFNVVSLHVNRDEFNAEFDGSLHCATRDILKNQIRERVYEKQEGLRHELVVKKQLTPEELKETVFNTGMKAFVNNTICFEMERSLNNIEASIKSVNQKLQDIFQRLDVFTQSLIKKAKEDDALFEVVSQLTGSLVQYATAKDCEIEAYKNLVLAAVSANEPLIKLFNELVKNQKQNVPSEPEKEAGGSVPDFYTR